MAGGEEPSLLPTKKPLIYHIFFWIAGLSTLFVWNCSLSQLGWYKARFDAKADFEIPFYFSAGSFMAFLVYDRIMKILKFTQCIIIIPVLLVIFSVLIYLLGEYINDAAPSRDKYFAMLPLVILEGFFNSIFQTTLIKYSFEFTYKEITAYNSGTALVGVMANLIAIANAYFLKGDEHLRMQALIYLTFQVVTLIAIILVFINYIVVCMKVPQRTDAESVASLDKQLVGTVTEVSPSEVSDRLLTPDTPLLDTMKLISPFFFNMILVYTISLAIFPGFCFSLGINWTDSETFAISIQLILLAFNIGDFVGKTAYGYLPLKDNIIPHLISLLRGGFLAFIIYVFTGDIKTDFLDIPVLTLGFTFALALTNGYVTSSLFHLSSVRAPSNHKANSGFLMTLGLLFGITYGSLSAAFGSS